MSINITATWILSSNCVNFWAKWLSFHTDTSKGQNKYNVKFYTISSKLMTELCDRKKVAQLSGEYQENIIVLKWMSDLKKNSVYDKIPKKYTIVWTYEKEAPILLLLTWMFLYISNYSHVFMKVKMHSEFLSINIIINFSYQ